MPKPTFKTVSNPNHYLLLGIQPIKQRQDHQVSVTKGQNRPGKWVFRDFQVGQYSLLKLCQLSKILLYWLTIAHDDTRQ